MKYLENLAERYFEPWTSDGIDAFHADVREITAWLKREDLRTEADAILDELTDDEIEKIASIISEKVLAAIGEENEELPAPETLQELTGQESGIVIYDSGETIVCNWSSLGENELPKVFSGQFVTGWDSEENIFEDAESSETEDFRPLLDGKEIIWDENGDLESIANGTYCWGDDFRATVWTLTDGTVIICPPLWN